MRGKRHCILKVDPHQGRESKMFIIPVLTGGDKLLSAEAPAFRREEQGWVEGCGIGGRES